VKFLVFNEGSKSLGIVFRKAAPLLKERKSVRTLQRPEISPESHVSKVVSGFRVKKSREILIQTADPQGRSEEANSHHQNEGSGSTNATTVFNNKTNKNTQSKYNPSNIFVLLTIRWCMSPNSTHKISINSRNRSNRRTKFHFKRNIKIRFLLTYNTPTRYPFL